LAPEVIMTTKGKTYDGKVGSGALGCWQLASSTHVSFAMQVADIWSCGVMLYVMLVGAYPFERPEDKHDNQKLQKMIQVGQETMAKEAMSSPHERIRCRMQRILRVEYDWPPHIKLSSECRDLMARILVAGKRTGIGMRP
jgi:serine/threonine-protein kinase SRK2